MHEQTINVCHEPLKNEINKQKLIDREYFHGC